MRPLLLSLKQGTMNGNGRPSTALTYGVFGLLAIVVIGVFGLAALNRDINQVVYFVGPIVVVLVGLIPVIAGQQKNAEKLDNIEKQTNGKLDARFAEVHRVIEGLSNQIALKKMGERPLTGEEIASRMSNGTEGESKDMSDDESR